MQIAPSSQVRILKGVPIDKSYRNSLSWDNIQAQTEYFGGKTKYIVDNCTYQRANLGTIKVGIKTENLYDCNYIMFNNVNFGSKWFYGFITEVNYVNNDVTEIKYEIDVVQTWYFDFSFEKCFIERQHTTTDNIGEHLIGENFDISDYVVSEAFLNPVSNTGKTMYNLFCKYVILRLDTLTISGGILPSLSVGFKQYDNQFSFAKLSVFEMSGRGITALKDSLLSLPENAVSGLYMCPIGCIANDISFTDDNPMYDITSGTEGQHYTFYINDITNNTSIDGYIPKNKKLYNYPFNYIGIDDGEGHSLTLKYEYFSRTVDGKISFNVDTSFLNKPSIRLTPVGYGNYISSTHFGNLLYQLTIDKFPTCPYTYSQFDTWLMGDAISQSIGGVANALTAGFTPTGRVRKTGIMGAGVELMGNILDTVGTGVSLSVKPVPVMGSATNNTLNFATKNIMFNINRYTINRDCAKSIDQFFTMYGYQINRVQTPNIKARPHYTYVKTKGCQIKGECPQDDVFKIESIFDNGITFWKNPSEVGNYSVDNTPT